MFAALGVGLRQLTGSPVWDGGASIAIGVLLFVVAVKLGMDSLIVAARVALADEMTADQAEDLADEIDRSLSQKLPVQPHVFIDPTQHVGAGSRETGEARRPAAP